LAAADLRDFAPKSELLTSTVPKPRFVALDGWRGICALLVAVHNLQYVKAPSFVVHSFLFVDFFFVLSGFVITHTYGQALQSGFSPGAFLLRRFGRLWPLHIVLLMVFVSLELLKTMAGNALQMSFQSPSFQPPNSAIAIFRNVLLIQAVGDHTNLSWNVPSWSISTEFWVYALFALIYLISPKRSPSVLLIGAMVLFAATVIALSVPDFLASNTDYAFFRCCFGFFAGHLTYRAWTVGGQKLFAGTLAELSAIAAIVIFVCIAGDDASSMMAPVVFGFAVWAFANENGAISKMLMARPFVQLGVWSYSIYMVHWLLRTAIKVIVAALSGKSMGTQSPLEGIDGNWTMIAITVAYLVAVVAVSAITYRLIEAPGRDYFNAISSALTRKKP